MSNLLDPYLGDWQRYARGFAEIAWGFPFTLIDFHISFHSIGVDVLPDLLGYIMFYFGVKKLLSLHKQANKLKYFSLFLMILSVFTLAKFKYVIYHQGQTTYSFDLLFPFDIAVVILDFFFVWMICGIIMDLGERLSREELIESADLNRKLYIGLSLLALVFLAMTMVSQSVMFLVPGILVLFGLYILLLFLMIRLMNKTNAILKEDGPKCHREPREGSH